jgi:hypothetical protein
MRETGGQVKGVGARLCPHDVRKPRPAATELTIVHSRALHRSTEPQREKSR